MAINFKNLNGGAVKSNVKYMKLVEGVNTFRILPDTILPAYTYWVKGANGKDLPFDALQFDRDTETFENSKPCPVSDQALLDTKGEPLRCQWSYKCRVINEVSGAVEILQLKKGILNDVIEVSQQVEVDPTDLDTGFWIPVVKKKTGSNAFNVEYSVQQLKCKSTSLSQENRDKMEGLKTMDELFPKETYAQQSERLLKHLRGDSAESAESASSSAASKEAVDELS